MYNIDIHNYFNLMCTIIKRIFLEYNINIMSHYYEKNVIDAKNIYTDYLTNILTPLLYEGFHHTYDESKTIEQNFIIAAKSDPAITNPGIISIFQYFLRDMDKLSTSQIETEAKRIRSESGCADIFDDLIKAVVKSHIIVLTYMNNGKKSRIVEDKFHERIDSKDFIHGCYIECAKLFYDHPYLFWHEFSNQEIKDNQRIIFQLIKIGIKNAIKRILPMKMILEEYLKNDYLPDNDEHPNFINIHDMLNKDKINDNNYDEGGRMAIIETSESSSNNDNLKKLEQSANDFAALIYGRQIHDTIEDVTQQQSDIKHHDTSSDTIIPPTIEYSKHNYSDKKDTSQIAGYKHESEKSKNTENSADKLKKIETLLMENKKGNKNINEKIMRDHINAAKPENSLKNNDSEIKLIRGTHNKSEKDNYYNDE